MSLLVVLRTDAGLPQYGNPIRRAIAKRFVLPVDIVIRSPEVLAEQRDDPYSLIHKVLEEGKVLYGRCVVTCTARNFRSSDFHRPLPLPRSQHSRRNLQRCNPIVPRH